MTVVIVVWLGSASVLGQDTTDTSPDAYLRPPQEIVDLLDARPTPEAVVSPGGHMVALTESPSAPPLGLLAAPMERLAGFRINPRSKTPRRPPQIGRILLVAVGEDDGEGTARHEILAPMGTTLGWVEFSPDGRYLSYSIIRDTGVELWVAETESGRPRAVTSAGLNATRGNPCEWLPDSRGVLCQFLPSARGAPPAAPRVPPGPNVQEHTGGGMAPVRTYQDLLSSAYDEALFTYHFSSQLGTVELATGRRTDVGQPGLFEEVRLAPDGQHLLVVRWKPPFSWLVPAGRFPKAIEVWNLGDQTVSHLADLPLADAVPIEGVPVGPRSHRWNTAAPATLVWTEALDAGDPQATVSHRDRVMSLAAPFEGPPAELMRTRFRFRNIAWTAGGVALIEERDRPTRWTRTWLQYTATGEVRQLWDRSDEDRYGDPGTPVTQPGRDARGVILQAGDSILLTGRGASDQGDRPFVDRLNLTTLDTVRIFQSHDSSYETLVAPLTADGRRLLTRRETATTPPNYLARDTVTQEYRTLTDYADPAPVLRNVKKQLITYAREDGVQLSATLYLPPGHRAGTRVPLLMWAYPREYTTAAAASQVSGSINRFTTVRGASHLALLTQGFAILDGPTMPIIGGSETANDTYVPQLVASAAAAVDAVVEMGIADRDRIAVGGHSYGAFMTANLLAHSDLFQAGIARSGAYNRTLTPFGFQNERRTFWERPDLYGDMSPFFHAHKVNEPILLTHGEVDNNSGTFPLQSERFYMALKGHGATVRYVTLPHESHGYVARESVLHVVTEMLNWCERYIGRGAVQ